MIATPYTSLTRTVAPTAYPVSLAEACSHLRIDTGDDDARVNALIAAATALFDGGAGTLGRCVMAQTWAVTYDGFPSAGGPIRLPLAGWDDALTVSSITYYDSAGDAQTLDSADYIVLADVVYLAPDESWPATQDRPNAITITFAAGAASSAAVPDGFRHAILLLVGFWYDQRLPVNMMQTQTPELPFVVTALTAPLRRRVIA